MSWARQKHNILADYFCNHALNLRQSVHENFDLIFPEGFNILVHSKGGARKDCSAAAWIVEITSWKSSSETWEMQQVAYSAAYIDSWMSSFTAETMALHQATDFVHHLIRRLHGLGVVGKIDL